MFEIVDSTLSKCIKYLEKLSEKIDKKIEEKNYYDSLPKYIPGEHVQCDCRIASKFYKTKLDHQCTKVASHNVKLNNTFSEANDLYNFLKDKYKTRFTFTVDEISVCDYHFKMINEYKTKKEEELEIKLKSEKHKKTLKKVNLIDINNCNID